MKHNITTVLDLIRSGEGEHFRVDESAILKEVEIEEAEDTSLVIKVLSVLGGLLGTMAFFGLMALMGIFPSLFFGVLFIVGAVILGNTTRTILLDTVIVSGFLAGIFMTALGLSEYNFDDIHLSQLLFLVGIVTLVLSRNYMLNVLSILMINGSLVYFSHLLKFPSAYHVIVGLNVSLLCYFMLWESKVLSSGQFFNIRYNAIRIGLIFSLLIGLLIFPNFTYLYRTELTLWMSSVIMAIAIFYTVYLLIKRYEVQVDTNQVLIYLLTLVFLVPSVIAPYLSGALLILLLSFYTQYQTGIGLGIIALIVAIIYYYYDLDLTLLTKSGVLVGSGILFLGLYYAIQKKMVSA